ncbi:helix-turn-helix transcriptional regulator [Clostridium sp.]|uniref:helix-turn-helix transcriptional regulator n=1 Tax=Clostridium sp. TaxID=1506 RepID=UPI002906D1D5|nr:helix-turn-helix transcriptional regulator [Clostridium sp.]
MNKIKELRSRMGLTVRELSKKSGVASSYISTLENDTDGTSNPTKEVMIKIAKALDSSVPKVFF